MNFLIFWLIPLYAGFAGRKQSVLTTFYSFLCMLFAVYLSVLSASPAGGVLTEILPESLAGFAVPGGMIIVFGIVWFIIHKGIENWLPSDSLRFEFPSWAEKILPPLCSFLCVELVVAILLAFVVSTPVGKYIPMLGTNPELGCAARLRLRQAIWAVDVLSFQPAKYKSMRSKQLAALLSKSVETKNEELAAEERQKDKALQEKKAIEDAVREKYFKELEEKNKEKKKIKKAKPKIIIYEDEPVPVDHSETTDASGVMDTREI